LKISTRRIRHDYGERMKAPLSLPGDSRRKYGFIAREKRATAGSDVARSKTSHVIKRNEKKRACNALMKKEKYETIILLEGDSSTRR